MRNLELTDPAAGSTVTRARRALTSVLLATLTIAAAGSAVSAAAASAAAHKPKAYTVKATSGTLTITWSSKVWSSLNSSLGSTIGTKTTAVAPAAETASGVITFPITHGSLNSATGRGTLDANGGISTESHLDVGGLFESSSSASVSSPVITIASASKVTITSSNFTPPTGVTLFTLNTAHVKAVGSKHSVTLSKIPTEITALGVDAFGSGLQANEVIGTATIQIKG
jgi:hypothetical protein